MRMMNLAVIDKQAGHGLCIRARATRAVRWLMLCWRVTRNWRICMDDAETQQTGSGIAHRLDRGTSGLLVVARKSSRRCWR